MRRDRMLVRLVVEIAKTPPSPLFAVDMSHHPMRASELRHDEPTAAQISDKSAENGVRHTRHRSQHDGRLDRNSTDLKLSGNVHRTILTEGVGRPCGLLGVECVWFVGVGGPSIPHPCTAALASSRTNLACFTTAQRLSSDCSSRLLLDRHETEIFDRSVVFVVSGGQRDVPLPGDSGDPGVRCG